MRRWIVLAVTLGLLTSVANAATPEVVLDDPDVSETHPSRSDGYLVWSARARTFVMPDGGDRVRVNPPDTISLAGAIDGTTVAYQEIRRRDSDIRFYDAMTQAYSDPPDGINSRNWEEDPALSGDWLLFIRSNINRVPRSDAWLRVLLVNLDTDERRRLLDTPYRQRYVATDQVNGDWATYETCRTPGGSFTQCNVYLYRISTETTTTVADTGQQEYAGGVTSDGTVYLVRSGNAQEWLCGKNAKIVRVPFGESPGDPIAALPDDVDALNSFAFEEMDDSVTYDFARLRCRTGAEGIYQIPDADTASLDT